MWLWLPGTSSMTLSAEPIGPPHQIYDFSVGNVVVFRRKVIAPSRYSAECSHGAFLNIGPCAAHHIHPMSPTLFSMVRVDPEWGAHTGHKGRCRYSRSRFDGADSKDMIPVVTRWGCPRGPTMVMPDQPNSKQQKDLGLATRAHSLRFTESGLDGLTHWSIAVTGMFHVKQLEPSAGDGDGVFHTGRLARMSMCRYVSRETARGASRIRMNRRVAS